MRAKICRKAARLIATNAPNGYPHQTCEYACESIVAAGGSDEMKEALKALFDDHGSYAYLTTFNGDTEKERPIRVLALCFMAAMVEAGDA